MSDLADLIPTHQPAEDVLALVGGMAIDTIPVVGPMAGRALDFALAARERERRYEFDVAIVEELKRVSDAREEGLTVADVVRSDDFLAAFTRASRAAAETSSAQRRHRLAAAVANSGAWADFSTTERDQYMRLAEEFTDLHIWLLVYLDDSNTWRADHGFDESRRYLPGEGNALSDVFGVPINEWWGPFVQAVDDLQRERLVAIQPELRDQHANQLHARTTHKGVRFRDFLHEPAPELAAVPAL